MNEEQLNFPLFEKNNESNIVCLGKTFENDTSRKKYFLEELRKLLPALKNKEGFPLATDEEILQLSDPPYFTLCPNPWINEFIDEWSNKTDDDYNVIKIIAEEDINETKKHTYKKGDEVKLSKADRNFITENLIEENTPFADDDEEE